MTFSDIRNALAQAGIPDPDTDAQILLEEATGLSAAALLLRRGESFDGEKLTEMLRRRLAREPLQYILGKWSFMGLDFAVCPDCLIPRADTELLAEEVLKSLPTGGTFADLCTGSGCIALSVLKFRPDARAVAVDLSEAALAVAKKNAEALAVSDRVTFLLGNVCTDLFRDEVFDLIVSNPPYVPTEDMREMEAELMHEPRIALDGGEDGMDVLRPILHLYPRHVKRGGKILLEFGYRSGSVLSEIAQSAKACGAISEFTIRKDLSQNDRMLVAIV